MSTSKVNTKTSLLALAAISVVISGINAERVRRIVGGENAAPNEFPWMARLNITDENGVNHDCGGAIISSRHILTAAHCLINVTLNSIWTGSVVRDAKLAVESKPAQIIPHPRYKLLVINGSEYNDNDVGIVTLTTDLKLDTNQNIILLANKKTGVNVNAVLAGWGFTNESRQNRAKILQKTSIIIKPGDKCPIKMPLQLCGWSLPHATPCQGDSGSPLVVNNRVVGVVSAGWCLVRRETVFANVYHHLSWIRSVID